MRITTIGRLRGTPRAAVRERYLDGIVSLLDQEHADLIKILWADLERKFGLRGIHAFRLPHFSYHVAEAYDEVMLEPVLSAFARAHSPFTVQTTGLGIFTGPQPVLHIPVVRTPELTRLHEELWQAIGDGPKGTLPLYHPRQWIPHITLAYGDIHNHMLPDLIRYLDGRSFSWEIWIDNLVMVLRGGTPQERHVRYRLGPACLDGEHIGP
jgi:2'-5' RNA ligase